MIFKDTETLQVLFIVFYSVLGTSLLWRSTVAFTYLKVKSAIKLLVYFRWWSCKQRFWASSCYFGLGAGLKNLVLFTSLGITTYRLTAFRREMSTQLMLQCSMAHFTIKCEMKEKPTVCTNRECLLYCSRHHLEHSCMLLVLEQEILVLQSVS